MTLILRQFQKAWFTAQNINLNKILNLMLKIYGANCNLSKIISWYKFYNYFLKSKRLRIFYKQPTQVL